MGLCKLNEFAASTNFPTATVTEQNFARTIYSCSQHKANLLMLLPN